MARVLEAAQHVPRAAARRSSASDGRLHTTFNQTVASTGRLSTSNPNLQSIPIRTELGRSIRSAFVAEQGCKLVSADYSQVELRILAHVSGEPKLREAFARGEDIHAATAAEVLGKDPAALTKDERNRAKAVNFGIIYGISAFGLSEQLEIPREEAQAYIDAYLARFPHVQDFIARTVEQAERDGFVARCSAAAARSRSCASNRQTRSLGERLAVNTVMQGTAADVIKVAMVRIHRPAARRGPRGPARAPGARRAPARGARERRWPRCASSCARRCAAPTRSIRRSSSTSAPARTGRTAKD